jgi:hypothetical protein
MSKKTEQEGGGVVMARQHAHRAGSQKHRANPTMRPHGGGRGSGCANGFAAAHHASQLFGL